jgi:hypothetical protein
MKNASQGASLTVLVCPDARVGPMRESFLLAAPVIQHEPVHRGRLPKLKSLQWEESEVERPFLVYL